MKQTLSQNLSLNEKASWVKRNGKLVEAEDFYSFMILSYLVKDARFRLIYDFSGEVASIEVDENRNDNFLSNQFESIL